MTTLMCLAVDCMKEMFKMVSYYYSHCFVSYWKKSTFPAVFVQINNETILFYNL